jgi:hypothetical protein
MAQLRGMIVTLKTASSEESDTDNQLYVGVWGTEGGREFPLASSDFDNNFATGSTQVFTLGTLPGGLVPAGSKQSDRAGPGEANDPGGALRIELNNVQYVYLRKQAVGFGSEDDDAYRLAEITVDLYSTNTNPDRRFRLDPRGLWFGNEHGHQAWLQEQSLGPTPRLSV